jgi:hypothetical protein
MIKSLMESLCKLQVKSLDKKLPNCGSNHHAGQTAAIKKSVSNAGQIAGQTTLPAVQTTLLVQKSTKRFAEQVVKKHRHPAGQSAGSTG